MKATQRTIPVLAMYLIPFKNTSGTLRAVENPDDVSISFYRLELSLEESDRLRIDFDGSGIRYIVLSYDVPILWVTNSGWTYRTERRLSQTSEKHLGLLYHLPAGFDKEHIKPDTR